MRDVVWSSEAQREFLKAIGYIAQDNPIAAEKVADHIEKAGNRLGVMATGRKGRVSGTYEKPVSGLPYIIVYAISARSDIREVVTILHIIHGARDWPVESWPI